MNNIFNYATKELSQDAFLCWSINWLTETETCPLYKYGKAILDLFLGKKKQEQYFNVEIRRQYEKIDVLVLFKDISNGAHALIIEDKTNTTEHSNQLLRYKEILLEKSSKDNSLQTYKNPDIHLAYIKTGIMYDKDTQIVGKGATVIDLDDLLHVVSKHAQINTSEILSSFYKYIKSIKSHRVAIETQIQSGHYSDALQDCYGQFCFMDKIFPSRSKGTIIGYQYVEHHANTPIVVDSIYAGTNNGGSPWVQYCFWGDKYPRNYITANKNEYHYMFWRIDCKWRNSELGWHPYFYIALRHYDESAHSGVDYLDNRKKFVYRKLRALADIQYEKYSHIFTKVGVRENYKESDLLFIPIEKIEHMNFDKIRVLLTEITNVFSQMDSGLYHGMEEAIIK